MNPANAFRLVERLLRLSCKLDVAAGSFMRAEAANNLPDSITGEAYVVIDVAEELDELACALDSWARENGGPRDGPLTAGSDTQEGT